MITNFDARLKLDAYHDKEEMMYRRFKEEFGFQPSELSFQRGYDAARIHLMVIAQFEVIPYVQERGEIYEHGMRHFSYATSLADHFLPTMSKELPPWSEFRAILQEWLSKDAEVAMPWYRQLWELFGF